MTKWSQDLHYIHPSSCITNAVHTHAHITQYTIITHYTVHNHNASILLPPDHLLKVHIIRRRNADPAISSPHPSVYSFTSCSITIPPSLTYTIYAQIADVENSDVSPNKTKGEKSARL